MLGEQSLSLAELYRFLVGPFCIGPLLLIGNLLFGFFAIRNRHINVYDGKKARGQIALVIGILLILGGLLSPFTYSLTGWFSLLVGIVIGFVVLFRSKGLEDFGAVGETVKIDGNPYHGTNQPATIPGNITQGSIPELIDMDTGPGPKGRAVSPAELEEFQRKATGPLASSPRPDEWGGPTKPLVDVDRYGEPYPIDQQVATRKVEFPRSEGSPLALLQVKKSNINQTEIYIYRDNFLIGRGREVDLQLLDAKVSRVHVKLRYALGYWYLQDQWSKSGTLVNGNRVEASKLNEGDEITIIHHKFIFHYLK